MYTYIYLEHDDYGFRTDIVATDKVATYRAPRGGWYRTGSEVVSPSDYATLGLVA
jgi:hypothetical protein